MFDELDIHHKIIGLLDFVNKIYQFHVYFAKLIAFPELQIRKSWQTAIKQTRSLSYKLQ